MKIKRTLRERKFIENYIENGGNATKAYLAINPEYEGKSARVLGHNYLTKLNISQIELLNEMGMTDEYLNRKLNEGLDAKKVVSIIPIIPKKDQSNDPSLSEATSKSLEFVDVDDYPTRHKYLDMAYKLKNKYPVEKKKIEIEGELKITDAKRKLVSKISGLASRAREEEVSK
jgi:hypothetical protein